MENKKEIFGYKCFFNEKLQAFNGFQYKIGKTYEIKDKPEVGHVGFHFYNDFKTAFRNFILANDKIICKVKVLGDVDSQDEFNCTNKIEILEEVVIDEKTKESLLNELVNDKNWYVREAVARRGYGLDKLINDEDTNVRAAVARQGYGLDKLVNDESWAVRETVAKQGYGLDKLIDDENWEVREEVAEQGFGLDKLVDDKNWQVRLAVAKQRYGLDKLVNDEYTPVRETVANQGYGLEKLVNDKDWSVREAVAKQGYGLDKLIDDEDEDVQIQVFLTILEYQDLTQEIKQLIKNYFNKAED